MESKKSQGNNSMLEFQKRNLRIKIKQLVTENNQLKELNSSENSDHQKEEGMSPTVEDPKTRPTSDGEGVGNFTYYIIKGSPRTKTLI